MDKHILKAETRSILGRKSKKLRAQGIIPANIFSSKSASISVQLSAKDFTKLFKTIGESTLVYLNIEGEKEPRPVLVRNIDRNPISNNILHISFQQVDLKAKAEAVVRVELVGESQAEKDGIGIMVQHLDELEIEALPTDIPEKISIDVSGLNQIDQTLLVSDIMTTSKIIIKTDPSSIVVKIEALAKEEPKEEPAPESPDKVEQPESQPESSAPKDKEQE